MNPPKKAIARFSPLYRSAVRDALILQGLLIFLCGLAADYGLLFAVALRAAFAFWIVTVGVIARRPLGPSVWDLRFIRFGYLGLLPLMEILINVIPERFRW